MDKEALQEKTTQVPVVLSASSRVVPFRQALLRVFRPHRDDVEDRPGLCCVGRGGGACRRWLQLSGLEDGARAWSPNLHSCSGGNAEVQTGRGVPGSVRGGPLPFFVDEEDTPGPMHVGMQEGS